MPDPSAFGVSDLLSLKYTGPNSNLVPIKAFNHRPTTNDKKFPIGQFAILNENPTTGTEGELWYLANFTALGQPNWVQLAVGGGGGGINTLTTDSGAPAVVPDGLGNINVLGAGSTTVTGNGPGNTVTVTSAGGGGAVTVTTDSGFPPVVQDGAGNINLLGGNNIQITGNGPGNTATVGIDPPVTIANGGTNAIAMATVNGIVKYNGTSLVTSTSALIDAANIMTNTSQPSFLAYLSADTGVIGGGGMIIPFDTIIYDVGGNFTTGVGAHFTAPKGGKYLFNVVITSIVAVPAQQWKIDIIVGGVPFTTFGNSLAAASATNDSISSSIIYPMALGDTMEINVQPATYNFNVKGRPLNICTYVSGQLLS